MTAKDLLYKILDYNHSWTSPDRIDSNPAMIRLSQIEKLLDVFGLTKKYVNPLIQIKYFFNGHTDHLNRARYLNKLTNLEYLSNGEFLNDRPIEANKELTEIVCSTIEQLFPNLSENIRNRPVDIKWLFTDLYNFRQEIHKYTCFKPEMLEGFSPGLHYSFHLQKKLTKLINDNIDEIDDTLWLILDPYQKDINMDDSDYPVADLGKIDLEWRMENNDY